MNRRNATITCTNVPSHARVWTRIGAYSVHNIFFAEQRYDGKPINDSRSCSVLFDPVYAYSFVPFSFIL